MNACGYKFYEYPAENEDDDGYGFVRLSEVSLLCNVEELKRLADFFNAEVESITNYLKRRNSTEQLNSGTENPAKEPEHCHTHLRDWDKKWKEGSSDLIIITELPPE